MLEKTLAFARENIVLTSVQHALGGFGLAVVLQHYLEGAAFAPLWLGWVFVAFSVVIHLYEFAIGIMGGSSARTGGRVGSSTTYSSLNT